MPRASARQTALKMLSEMIAARTHAAEQQYLLDKIDAFVDDIDELLVMEREQVSSSRYFARPQKYRKRGDRWKLLLFDREFLYDTATEALLKLQGSAITWLDQDERSAIADRIQSKFDVVNCVGMVDGTLLPLEFKPTKSGEDYFY